MRGGRGRPLGPRRERKQAVHEQGLRIGRTQPRKAAQGVVEGAVLVENPRGGDRRIPGPTRGRAPAPRPPRAPIRASGFRSRTYGDRPRLQPTLTPWANPRLVDWATASTGRSAIASRLPMAESLSTTVTCTSAFGTAPRRTPAAGRDSCTRRSPRRPRPWFQATSAPPPKAPPRRFRAWAGPVSRHDFGGNLTPTRGPGGGARREGRVR